MPILRILRCDRCGLESPTAEIQSPGTRGYSVPAEWNWQVRRRFRSSVFRVWCPACQAVIARRCERCAHEAVPGRTLCPAHAARSREVQNAYRARRQTTGPPEAAP